MTTRHYDGFWYEAVYSDDDGGFYCEVFRSSGGTVYKTGVYGSKIEAVRDAIAWINAFNGNEKGS